LDGSGLAVTGLSNLWTEAGHRQLKVGEGHFLVDFDSISMKRYFRRESEIVIPVASEVPSLSDLFRRLFSGKDIKLRFFPPPHPEFAEFAEFEMWDRPGAINR
jgi:hypothetical protein